MTWTGPHEVVTTVNPFVYEVRPCVADQGKRKPRLVHVVRIRRFANAPLGTAADTAAIEKAARHDFSDNIPQRLIAHSSAGGLKLKVRWLGFDSAHDSWEPVANLAEDVSEMMVEAGTETCHVNASKLEIRWKRRQPNRWRKGGASIVYAHRQIQVRLAGRMRAGISPQTSGPTMTLEPRYIRAFTR